MELLNGMCKLCLEKCENFKATDEYTRNAFDTVLLPKIDFTAIQGSVMCKNCTDVLKKCFDFKKKCLDTHDYMVLFVNEDNVELDLRDVYMSKNETDTDFAEDEDICALCLDLVKNCSSMCLDVEGRDVMLEIMIEECLPELDLSIINKPAICAPCLESLEDYFRFVMNCLIIDKRIKKQCETVDINSGGQAELNSLSQFTRRDVATREVDIIKVEKELCEDRKNPIERKIGKGGDLIKLEEMFFIDNEDANEDVENKNEGFMEFDDQNHDQQPSTPNNVCAYEEEGNKLSSIKIEEIFCEENETKYSQGNLNEIEDQKFLFNEAIEIKTDEHDFNSKEMANSEERKFLCSEFSSARKDVLNWHVRTILEKEKFPKFQCGKCEYETVHKIHFNAHMKTHKSKAPRLYQCNGCPRKGFIREKELHDHILRHHQALLHLITSEVHHCTFCNYKTVQVPYLRRHIQQKHEKNSARHYDCNICDFSTVYKKNLNIHLKTHTNPNRFICPECSKSFNQKCQLDNHVLRHHPLDMNLLEMITNKIHSCYICAYKTIKKSDLILHFKKHKKHNKTVRKTVHVI